MGLGSNLGDREAYMREALERLSRHSEVKIRGLSSLYESEPWGNKNQGPFLNAVVEIETGLSPKGLLAFIEQIEQEMGRKREVQWGPRLIDVDILFYDQLVIEEKDLKIPHPHIPQRAFVLEPMAEVAPNLLHPLLLKTMKELRDEHKEEGVKHFKCL